MLNSNDFDFLQSRGAKSVDPEEDRRSSLLLRFDPLSGRTTQKLQLAPTAETVESASASEQSFRASDTVFCNANNFDATHAAEMSVSLIHDSNNMDNETNSYANNIK